MSFEDKYDKDFYTLSVIIIHYYSVLAIIDTTFTDVHTFFFFFFTADVYLCLMFSREIINAVLSVLTEDKTDTPSEWFLQETFFFLRCTP